MVVQAAKAAAVEIVTDVLEMFYGLVVSEMLRQNADVIAKRTNRCALSLTDRPAKDQGRVRSYASLGWPKSEDKFARIMTLKMQGVGAVAIIIGAVITPVASVRAQSSPPSMPWCDVDSGAEMRCVYATWDDCEKWRSFSGRLCIPNPYVLDFDS